MPGTGTLEYTHPEKPYAVTKLAFTGSGIDTKRQSIDYTSFQRPKYLFNEPMLATFIYNASGERVKMLVSPKGANVPPMYQFHYENTYISNYEHHSNGGREILYLGGDAYSAPAVYVKQYSGDWKIYYICRDYLGSITHIANADGSLEEEKSYNAWGRLRSPETHELLPQEGWNMLFLSRGYTGHEQLDVFGLINMNARLYDPAIGRFLSPDPYVQAPNFTQNFNRYSYCLNNPLVYVDPSGEWFGIDDLFVAGAGFVFGYVSHGISTGNWGWKAVAAGGTGAGMAWIGYNTAGLATGSITNATWNQVGSMAINTVANQIIPPMYIPIGDHFGIGISPAFGLGASGLTGGLNVTGAYTNGDFSISAGIGAGDNYWGWNATATYAGWGGGYGQTSYGASEVMGQQLDAQRVGTISAYFNHNSFSLSNDFLGDKGDRWRTNAAELTIGKWSVGTYLYTNDGKEASGGMKDPSENCIPPCPVGLKKNGNLETWTNGRPYSAPFWVGYRNGNQITRFGFSHEIVHNLTQNMVHKFMSTPYYMSYDEFRRGAYFYTGYRNPLSLWDR